MRALRTTSSVGRDLGHFGPGVRLTAFTDGASRGNPGESGIGVVLLDSEGKTVDEVFGYIGISTNNRAEYAALLVCVRLASALQCTHLLSHSDSELLVRQMRGEYKIKDKILRQWAQTIHEELARTRITLELKHVRREENADADRLANEGIDTKKPLPDPSVLKGLLFSGEQS